MASLNDYEMDRIQHAWTQVGVSTDNASVTVTNAAVIGRHNVLVKVDASFSTIDGTGLLTVKQGSVTVGLKYIHGAGALDFAEFGYESVTANEAVSAVLTGGGAGILGVITMTGYMTGVRAGD